MTADTPTTDELVTRLRDGSGSPPDVDALADAAAAAGVLDVAYSTVDTRVGRLLAAVTPSGLVRLAFAADEDAVLDELAARLSRRLLRAPARLAPVVAQLEEYLDGRRRAFDLPVDRRLMGRFQAAVLARAASIPYGTTTTYATVATEAGSPRGARAAGQALAANPVCIVVPCHRVVPAGGGVGGYAGGAQVKRRLLALEAAPLDQRRPAVR